MFSNGPIVNFIRVAYDLDGVISKTPVRFYSLLKRCRPILYVCSLLCPVKMRPLRNPDGRQFVTIITGRSIKDKKITEIWLKLHGIIGDVYYNPNGYSKESAIEHKAKTINELGIEVYYEDEWDVAKELQRRCPKCEIRIV